MVKAANVLPYVVSKLSLSAFENSSSKSSSDDNRIVRLAPMVCLAKSAVVGMLVKMCSFTSSPPAVFEILFIKHSTLACARAIILDSTAVS